MSNMPIQQQQYMTGMPGMGGMGGMPNMGMPGMGGMGMPGMGVYATNMNPMMGGGFGMPGMGGGYGMGPMGGMGGNPMASMNPPSSGFGGAPAGGPP